MTVFGVFKERSSIRPEEELNKRRELKFKYDTSEYDSFRKNGFEAPDRFYRPDKWEVKFLSEVDIEKGPIKVRITRMFRTKAIDYSNDKEKMKDYIFWESEWTALNWLKVKLRVGEHFEGKYTEQTKELKLGDFDPKTGIRQMDYVRGMPKTVYTIPFSKKAVDDILNNKHPFGADSENITNIDSVKFYGKFDNTTESSSFRCGNFTYEQFVTPEWRTFFELATRRGGPPGLREDQKDKYVVQPSESFIK